MRKIGIRWGIIGAGTIAHAFVNDFQWMKNASLAAVACSDLRRGKAFADKYQIPGVLTYEELYKSEDIDAVYIATIHPRHFEQAFQCMKEGKAVLCEKPATVTGSQFDELAAFSKKSRIFLMEAMWTYFLPAVIKAKQWIDEKRIGEVKVIQADFAYPMDPVKQAKLFDSSLAGGSMLELGIYPIALAYLVMERDPVKLQSTALINASGVDEQLSVTLQYESAMVALFSSIVTRMSNTARIFGSKGYIEIPDFWRAYGCSLYDEEFTLIESFQDDRESHGFIYEMQHANDLIQAGAYESPVMPHTRSHSFQRIMSEIRAQTGIKFC